MDENQKEVLPTAVKFASFIQANLVTIVIVLVCLVYILRGFIEVSTNDKTIQEVIFDSSASFLMGISLSILLGKKAIIDGKNNMQYLNSLVAYSNALGDISNDIDKLGMYCDYKNDTKLKVKKTEYLQKYQLIYAKVRKCEYDYEKLTEEQKRALVDVEKIKISKLTFEYLTYDCNYSDDDERNVDTLSKFERKQNKKTVTTKMICAIIFGFFGIQMVKDTSLATLIYSSFQIIFWLSMGVMQYLTNYNYVTETYRQNAIIRKTNYLIEFKQLLKSKPEIFIEVKENGGKKDEPIELQEPINELSKSVIGIGKNETNSTTEY